MIGLVTYVYPGAEKFIKDLCHTINNQIESEFDVILFNDGLNVVLELSDNIQNNVNIIDVSGSIFEIRRTSLIILKDLGYEYLVFQDSDDLMTKNSISSKVAYLKDYDIVVNDLNIVSHKGKTIQNGTWSHRLKNGFEFDHNFLFNKNIAGLGNTAIRCSALSDSIEKPRMDPIAGDWFLFFSLMKNNKLNGVFTSECQTAYRQHESNIVGIQSLSKDSLLQTIKVKKVHYDIIEMKYELDNLMLIEEKIRNDKFKTSINNDYPLFWWENINYIL